MMLAIVIPYYKIDFFEITLESLSKQTDRRFKVYIGNDASPANPNFLINKYHNQLNIIYKEFDYNLGSHSLTEHWKRCIDLTQSEDWIMLLGDDDVIDVNLVSEFYRQYEIFYERSNVVRFASQLIDENNDPKSAVFKHPKWEKAEDSYFRKIKGSNRSSLSEYIFSKNSFLKYRFYNFPLGWHSDDLAWLEFSNGLKIYSINNALVYIRLSTKSISGRNDNLNLKNIATTQFYKILISQNRINFNLEHEKLLLKEYQKQLLSTDNFTIQDNLILLIHFFKANDFKACFTLMRRILKKKLSGFRYMVG